MEAWARVAGWLWKGGEGRESKRLGRWRPPTALMLSLIFARSNAFSVAERDMSEDEVVLADAMKCNAMDSYFDVLEKKGRVGLGIPGCTTGFIQNNDVTCHGPLAGAYKRRENSESLAALREGYPVPPTDKQVVYDRTIGAWGDLNHERISFGFVQIGVTNDLFGTQDKDLSKDVLPIWLDQKMSEKREEIRQEMEADVKSGKYTPAQATPGSV